MSQCLYCGKLFKSDNAYALHLSFCVARTTVLSRGRLTEKEIGKRDCEGLAFGQDPLASAVKKAYRGSDLYQLEKLLAEESRWKRKVTIASNKLASVRERINRMAIRMATPVTEAIQPEKEK